MTTLTTTDIENRIPHRFQNLLLDTCTITGENECTFNLEIKPQDTLGRDIFLKRHSFGNTIMIPILAEIAALASITCSGMIESGAFAYFAAITKFSLESNAFKSEDLIHGEAKKDSEKNGFYKFHFDISSSSGGFATGQIMAFLDLIGDTDTVDVDAIELPDHILQSKSDRETIVPFASKSPGMTFVDAYHPLDDPNEFLFSYKYPSSHPLIQGHFPGNPVMMGVCQWIILEDAVTYIMNQLNLSDSEQIISLHASIFKDNNTPVCDLKNIKLHAKKGLDSWDVNTIFAKKVLFKQRVLPHDQVYLYITSFTLSS